MYLSHEIFVEQYPKDDYFKDLYEALINGNCIEEVNDHVKKNLLYHVVKICIPIDERVTMIREAHK